MFSVPHMLNILIGKDLIHTIIQVMFALLIGLISAMLIVKTSNIIPLIIYHFLNNTVNSIIRTSVDTNFSLYLNLIIFGFGLIYLYCIYQSLRQSKVY
jgi:membrane protease YdiL (CAAX protease family)